MFFIRRKYNDRVNSIYEGIIDEARNPILYNKFNVPDTPAGRFQMIALHAIPVMIMFAERGEVKNSQLLFDKIFKDIELSFREIGVGDLSVPKKMKAYMQDFNGLLHAHTQVNADHVAITGQNVFDDSKAVNKPFASYILSLFAK